MAALPGGHGLSSSVDGEGSSEVGQCSLLTLTPVKAVVPYRVM